MVMTNKSQARLTTMANFGLPGSKRTSQSTGKTTTSSIAAATITTRTGRGSKFTAWHCCSAAVLFLLVGELLETGTASDGSQKIVSAATTNRR
jgi:hypothetical protein